MRSNARDLARARGHLTKQWGGHTHKNFNVSLYEDRLIEYYGNKCYTLGEAMKFMGSDADGISYFVIGMDIPPLWWSYA